MLLSWYLFLFFDGVIWYILVLDWVVVGDFYFEWVICIDCLIVIMLIVVNLVLVLVYIYLMGYMVYDDNFGYYEYYKVWFFVYLLFFIFVMLMLVMVDNLL